MVEIETKVLGVSHNDYEQKIFSLGGKKIFEGELFAVFLSDGSGDFQGRDKVLRIRQNGENASLAFKCKIIDSEDDSLKTTNDSAKIREEIEVGIDDFEKTLLLFEKLGFKEKSRAVKTRVSYLIESEGIQLDFDDYLGEDSFIPEFLEIEGETEQKIEEFAKKLGFEVEDLKPWGYSRLREYYRQ